MSWKRVRFPASLCATYLTPDALLYWIWVVFFLSVNEGRLLLADFDFHIRRLGWLELKVTLAKLFFQYDVTLLSKEVSWQDEAQMHLLWKRPTLVTVQSATPPQHTNT